jgi:hypothetical protein
MNSRDEVGVSVTPEHSFVTPVGFKEVQHIEENESIMKLMFNCIVCDKETNYNYPKIVCDMNCREKFYHNVINYADNLNHMKFGMQEFSAKNITYFKHSHPAMLHDITVEEDESFFINGIGSKNCRCLIIAVFDGYGFDSGGKLTYIGQDHDEWENQKSFRKSLSEDFLKHDCEEHKL